MSHARHRNSAWRLDSSTLFKLTEGESGLLSVASLDAIISSFSFHMQSSSSKTASTVRSGHPVGAAVAPGAAAALLALFDGDGDGSSHSRKKNLYCMYVV